MHIEDLQTYSRKSLWRITTHRPPGLSQPLLLGVGPAEALLGQQRFDGQAPALIGVPAGAMHSFGFADDTAGYVMTVDLERLQADCRRHGEWYRRRARLKDAAYFSRFFRRHCGLSPNAFRRNHTGG